MKRIRYCGNCRDYTLKQKCGKCGSDTIINSPSRYVNDETLARYRRTIKRGQLESNGILKKERTG